MITYHSKSQVEAAVKALQELYSKEINTAGSHIFFLKALKWEFVEFFASTSNLLHVDASNTKDLNVILCKSTWNDGITKTGNKVQNDNWFKILPTENERHLEKYVYELLDGVCLFPYTDLSSNNSDQP